MPKAVFCALRHVRKMPGRKFVAAAQGEIRPSASASFTVKLTSIAYVSRGAIGTSNIGNLYVLAHPRAEMGTMSRIMLLSGYSRHGKDHLQSIPLNLTAGEAMTAKLNEPPPHKLSCHGKYSRYN